VSDVKLAPSILAADFARLGQQVTEAAQAGADRIHVDVMDGHFVPNLSMGPAIIQSLRRVTDLPLETHLMVTDPDLFLDEFAAAGSDSLLVHWEGNANLHRTVQRIRTLGKRAGVVINPATPAAVLEEIVQDVDQVLVMTVKDPQLENFRGRVSDSGEGRWTIRAAIDEAVPTPVLSSALYERFSSRGEADFGDKLLSAMRFEFGGHLEKPAA
jgi:hypothetical protein